MASAANKGLKSKSPASAEEIWSKFVNDKKLRETYRVTDQDLANLKTMSLFGDLKGVEDIVFILKMTRGVRGSDLADK